MVDLLALVEVADRPVTEHVAEVDSDLLMKMICSCNRRAGLERWPCLHYWK